MNSPLVGVLLAAAVGATAVAIWAGPDLAIAGPAAAFAVLVAGLLLARAWLHRREPPAPAPSPPPDRDVFLFRYGFRSGRLGREEIVATLDRIDRAGPTPHLPGRSAREMNEIVGLTGSDFREYVRHRLDELESGT